MFTIQLTFHYMELLKYCLFYLSNVCSIHNITIVSHVRILACNVLTMSVFPGNFLDEYLVFTCFVFFAIIYTTISLYYWIGNQR